MSNPELYVHHPLNSSTTKQTFTFPKGERFRHGRRSLGDLFYDLPTTNTRRSCGFGFGEKTSFAEKEKSPPPGAYEPKSDFGSLGRNSTISFSLGRNQVKFGYFLGESMKNRASPSPNAYRIKTDTYYSKKCGRMAAKLPTQIDLASKKKNPGPGTYKLDVTEMKGSGSYILSNYRNNVSPKFISSTNRSRSPTNDSLGPGQCTFIKNLDDPSSDKFGRSLISKFKNSITSSFSKEERPGLEDKSKIKFPGFKYKRFSEFHGVEN